MDRQRTTTHRKTLSASSLIGDAVVNSAGEDLGSLKEIMIDVDEGKIAYGVLQSGDFLGMGGKLFAVPFEAFRIDERNKRLLLDVDAETIQNAQGFDNDRWPDTSDPEFINRTHQHFGYSPYWDRASRTKR
jgi:sporulation protein YlmC with PRC-barrel domain